MLAVFRAFSKSWVAKILLGVLAIAFGIWGIQGALTPKISTAVVTAGQRQITEQEFRQLVDNQLNQIRQQTGQSVTLQQLVKMGVPQQWAQQLAQDEAIQAWIGQAGIKPAKSLNTDAIKSNPNLAAVFNPITGAFDEKTFRLILAQNGMTEEAFFRQLHDQIATRHLGSAVQAGLQAPMLSAALQTELMLQTRDATIFQLNAKALGPLPTPTQADLQQLYNTLGDSVRRQETRALTLVVFDPRKVAETVTVDPAEVQKVFNFRKDSYSTPEKRTFVQISAKDGASAARIAQALKAGQAPDAAAKAGAGQVQTQADLAKSAVPDAKVAAVAFALQPGQVSDPIQGDLGWAVVKLQSVTPGKPATLEEKRAEIEAGLRQQLAKDKVSDMVQKYSEARDAGASAADAGAKVGAIVNHLPPVTAQGQSYGEAQINVTPNMQKVLQTGFGLPKGGKSDPQRLEGGGYYAVQVDDIHPAYKPSLDEIRPQVAAAWTQRTIATRLKAKADELVASMKKGAPIAQAAASVGAQAQHLADVPRGSGQRNDPRAVVSQVIFSAPVGQPFATQVTASDFLVGKVDAVHSPATVKAAELAASRGRDATSHALYQDMIQSLQTAANAKIKPKVDTRNLNTALGLNEQGQPQQ
jgi:peptidyl-prolyl cis-trans isomerase D